MALLLPYIITLAWTGRIEEKKEVPLITSGKKVILDRKNGESYMDVEEYLPGVVAKQMPAAHCVIACMDFSLLDSLLCFTYLVRSQW